MSHATRHALATLVMSTDSRDALDEIARMIDEEITAVDPLDLDLSRDDLDALDLATVDLDLDLIDATMIDRVAYFDANAYESLDDMIDAFDR